MYEHQLLQAALARELNDYSTLSWEQLIQLLNASPVESGFEVSSEGPYCEVKIIIEHKVEAGEYIHVHGIITDGCLEYESEGFFRDRPRSSDD